MIEDVKILLNTQFLTPEWLMVSLTLVYTLITLITVYYISRQLREINKNSLSSSYHFIYDKMIDIDKFFISNPEFKKYFYSGESHESLDDLSKNQLLSIAEMLVDFFDCVYYQKNVMREETFMAKAHYIGDIYKNSPIIREYLNQPNLDKWYSTEFLEFIKRQAALNGYYEDKLELKESEKSVEDSKNRSLDKNEQTS